MITAKQVFDRLMDDTRILVFVAKELEAEYSQKSKVPTALLEVPMVDWGFGFDSEGEVLREVYFELHYIGSSYPLERADGAPSSTEQPTGG